MYLQARGVAQDFNEALTWFRLAAAQNNAAAQTNLGVMYQEGKGVPKDFNEALKWHRLGAAQGNAGAQSNLGEMYGDGIGITKNFVQAYMWVNLAAAKGSATAVRLRDDYTKKMTAQQIAEAQTMARKCEASNYKQCD